jgi:hypothetical protein
MTSQGDSGHDGVSTFALDVHWASGRTDSALEAHVAGCARCQAYLAKLDEILASNAQGAPSETKEAASPRALTIVAPRGRWVRAWAVAASGLALAAGVALFVGRTPAASSASSGYVGTKGMPAVQVLVRRGNDTSIWDGRAPLHPGDVLALRVACEGLSRVTVAAPGASGWERLSESGCSSEPLPFTLVVDGEPGDEKLAVVLSDQAIDTERLRAAIEQSTKSAELWTFSFVLPKALGR